MGHFSALITTQLLLLSRSAEGVTLAPWKPDAMDAMFAWLVFWSVLIWNLSFALTMNKDAYLLNDVNSGHFTEFSFRLLARRWAVSGESNENWYPSKLHVLMFFVHSYSDILAKLDCFFFFMSKVMCPRLDKNK